MIMLPVTNDVAPSIAISFNALIIQFKLESSI
jgi:hypothetical protein